MRRRDQSHRVLRGWTALQHRRTAEDGSAHQRGHSGLQKGGQQTCRRDYAEVIGEQIKKSQRQDRTHEIRQTCLGRQAVRL